MKSFKHYLTEVHGVEDLGEFADDSTSAIPGTPKSLKEMSPDQVFFKVSGRAQEIMNKMKWDKERLKSLETHGDTYALNKKDAEELRAELIRQGAIDDFVEEDSLSDKEQTTKSDKEHLLGEDSYETPELIRVTIGQALRHKLVNAIKDLLGDDAIEQQGYTDASTSWAVIIYNDPKYKWSLGALEDKLREKMNYSHWMRVEREDEDSVL